MKYLIRFNFRLPLISAPNFCPFDRPPPLSSWAFFQHKFSQILLGCLWSGELRNLEQHVHSKCVFEDKKRTHFVLQVGVRPFVFISYFLIYFIGSVVFSTRWPLLELKKLRKFGYERMLQIVVIEKLESEIKGLKHIEHIPRSTKFFRKNPFLKWVNGLKYDRPLDSFFFSFFFTEWDHNAMIQMSLFRAHAL